MNKHAAMLEHMAAMRAAKQAKEAQRQSPWKHVLGVPAGHDVQVDAEALRRGLLAAGRDRSLPWKLRKQAGDALLRLVDNHGAPTLRDLEAAKRIIAERDKSH